MKPFAARNLFERHFTMSGENLCFIADPGTQRWVIGNELLTRILPLADGATEIADISNKSGIPHHTVEHTLRALEDEGLIFPGEEPYRRDSQPIVRDTEVQALHLEITNKCNLRCTHCYLSSGRKQKNELNINEIMDAIDQLEPVSGAKVCITGGEPLLHPNFFEILEYVAVTRKLEADIYTNAQLINESVASRLQEINKNAPFGVNIQISIEGADEETNDAVRGKGVFQRVGQAINRLIELGMGKNIVLFVCLTKDNISQVPELIRIAEVLNLKALKFSQWQKQGRSAGVSWADKSPSLEDWLQCGHTLLAYPQERTFLLGNFWGDLKNDSSFGFSLDGRLFPKFICNLKVAPRIDCKGQVWPCQVFVDQASIVGNMRRQSLSQIFRGKKYLDLLKKCAQREDTVAECRQCQWQHFCGAGCAGFAFAEHETFQVKDFFCDVRKYWFEQYLARKLDQFKFSAAQYPAYQVR